MINKFIICLALVLSGCSTQSPRTYNDSQGSVVPGIILPLGLSVVEKHPNGFFIRLSSASRLSDNEIKALVDSLNFSFDRIDLCLDVAHERGDEYTSIIGYKVFDHENDNIYSLEK